MEELVILYEDNHIIVVLKPQNIPCCEDESKDKDLLTMIKEYIKVKYNKTGNVYLGLVHRLDRPTGGVMVFAKSSKAASRLSEQLREGDFEKRYFAVLVGVPKEETSQNQQAIIDALNGSTKIFVIIYTVIVAPIIEEIVFRKLFYNVLKRHTKLPVWAIVLIISFVFAFIHVSDLESIKFLPQYFVLAFVITGVYAITKENIFASISLHGINNLIAVLQIVL